MSILNPDSAHALCLCNCIDKAKHAHSSGIIIIDDMVHMRDEQLPSLMSHSLSAVKSRLSTETGR